MRTAASCCPSAQAAFRGRALRASKGGAHTHKGARAHMLSHMHMLLHMCVTHTQMCADARAYMHVLECACECVHACECAQAGSTAVAPRQTHGVGLGLACGPQAVSRGVPRPPVAREWAWRSKPLKETATRATMLGLPPLQGPPGTRRLQPRKVWKAVRQAPGPAVYLAMERGAEHPKRTRHRSQPASGPASLGQELRSPAPPLPCPGWTLPLPLALGLLSCAPSLF